MEAVGNFKASPSFDSSKLIATRFIGNKSRTPVNISGPTVDSILQEIKEGGYHKEMFDSACAEILQLLRNDSFRRFTRQKLTKQNTLLGDNNYSPTSTISVVIPLSSNSQQL